MTTPTQAEKELYEADEQAARLRREAMLMNATFFGTDLRGADFRGADLMNADFAGADLRATKLAGATHVYTGGALTDAAWERLS